jgi:hypothetical protein
MQIRSGDEIIFNENTGAAPKPPPVGLALHRGRFPALRSSESLQHRG